MCKSAIEGQPIGLFIGPNIPGIWSVENSSNATLYYDNIFISEEEIKHDLVRF